MKQNVITFHKWITLNNSSFYLKSIGWYVCFCQVGWISKVSLQYIFCKNKIYLIDIFVRIV